MGCRERDDEADRALVDQQASLVEALKEWVALPVDLNYVREQFDSLNKSRRLLVWVSPEGTLSAIREDVATPFEPRSNWGVVLNRDFKNAEVFVLSIEGSNKERPRYRIADFQTKPVRVFNVTVNTIEFQVPARSENRYTEAQTKVFEQAPDELQLKAMMFLDSMAWLYGNEAAEKIEIKFSQTPIAPHEYPKQELRFFSAEIGAGNLIVLQITSDAKGVMQTGPESYIWEAMKVASDEKEIPTAFVDGLNLFRFYQEQILTIQSESARPTAEHIVKEFARRALLKDLFNPNRVLGMQGAPMTLSYEKPQGPSLLGSKPALLFKFERGEGAEKIIHRLRFEINQKGELVYTYTTQLQKGFFGPKLSSQGWLAMDDFIQTYNRSEARNDAKAKQVAQQIERKLVNKAAFMGAAKKVAVKRRLKFLHETMIYLPNTKIFLK